MIGDKLSFILFNVVGGATTLALGGLLYAQHTGNFEIVGRDQEELKKAREALNSYSAWAKNLLLPSSAGPLPPVSGTNSSSPSTETKL